MTAGQGRASWIARGDINAFFGLMLDNMTQIVILAGILMNIFGFSREIVLLRIIPGTAIGVLLGDLIYTWMAVRLARREGRKNVTAMPLGIDTPSLFGLTFGVLGPVMVATGDEVLAWKIGMALMVMMGILKFLCAFASDWVRRVVPRAGLLGSIAAVAILLIAFLPALKLFGEPVVGFLSLGIVLTCLVARIALPAGFPGALLAAGLGTIAFYVLGAAGLTHHAVPSLSEALTLHPACRCRASIFSTAFRLPSPTFRSPFPSRWPRLSGGSTTRSRLPRRAMSTARAT